MRLLLAALLLAASPAQAAFLRPATQLQSSVVLLSDLFTDAGPQATLVLGPAPAPGEHIVVGAAQLDAIARQFGVAWRAQSGGERAVLERPGVPLPRAPVVAALRAALDAQGAPPGEVMLPAFAPPLVAPEAAPEIAVEQASYEAATARFSAGLLVTGRDMAPQRLRISGVVAAMQDLPVATRLLAAGAVVGPDDLHTARLPATLAMGADMVQDAREAVGQALRHAVPAGQPVLRANLARPAAVARGDVVAMQLAQGDLLLTATGTALQSGAFGDRIDVLNPTSHAIILAEIVGVDAVRVAPGTQPRRPPAAPGANAVLPQ